MKTLGKFCAALLPLCLSAPAIAYNNLPASGTLPDVVHLRKDCSAGNPSLVNCADNMSEMLTWVWGTRLPGVASPLLIDVGPGTFYDFNCQGKSSVTLRGSGRDNTTIAGSGPGANQGAAVMVSGCSKLAFQDMTISGDDFAIQWWNGGSSTYSNVHVTAAGFGWWDYSVFGGQSLHYWFGSKIESTGTSDVEPSGIFSYSGEHWFYGGEITFMATSAGVAGRTGAVVLPATGGQSADVRLFGTAVRAFATAGALLDGPLVAVRVEQGEFHMHGGIINATATAAGNADADATAIFHQGFAQRVHTPDTAFVVNAKGNGTALRLGGMATNVGSPFLWPAGSNPPAVGSVKSGADQFVENDCSVAGNCDGGGNETHLMIANQAKCGSVDPWFDTQTNACRKDNTP